MAANTALEIEILDGSKQLLRQTFDQGKIIIGRILSADLKIANPKVSRIHALIERMDDGSFRLTDLASTHGTFVNGERIVEKIIRPGDKVEIATLTVKINFVAAGAEATAALGTREPTPAPKSATKAPTPAAKREMTVSPGGQVAADGPREPTQIRSLKETARTRGVLEAHGSSEELEITAYWENTVLAVDHFKKSSGATVTIGENEGVNYIVPSQAIGARYNFVKVRGATAEINLHESMKGSVRAQGRMQTLQELINQGQRQVTISGHDLAKIQVGTVNFFLMFVPEPPPTPRDRVIDQGPMFWLSLVFSAGMAALFLLVGSMYREPIEGQVREFPEKFRKIIVQEWTAKMEKPPVEEKKEEPKPEPPKEEARVAKVAKQGGQTTPTKANIPLAAQKQEGGGAEGARAKGEEGRRGREWAKQQTGAPKGSTVTGLKGKPGGGGTNAWGAPVQAPKKSLLDSLKASGLGGRIAAMGGGPNLGVRGAGNGTGGQGGLENDLQGIAEGGEDGVGGKGTGYGSGGQGIQGTGKGGGGTKEGVGGLGTKGFGPGLNGTGAVPGKGAFDITTESAEITVLGGLSREEIERVIRAHESEVQFCYSRELQRDPKLFGKIKLKWTIVGGGRVSGESVINNQTGSAPLGDCIKRALRGWQFPSPPGGSSAVVEWAWNFKPKL